MSNLKHVGRIISNKRKVVVAYRVIPGEPDYSIVVTTENLDAAEHDALIKLVESSTGQDAYEFAEVMARAALPDGRNMLAGFHTTGKMIKIKSDLVEMTPNNASVVKLSDLNQAVAEQRGVTVADLALKGPDGKTVPVKETVAEKTINPVESYVQPTSVANDGVLTDEALAAQYRSQADALYKEAKRLREQAEELSPTKKKSAKKIEESA